MMECNKEEAVRAMELAEKKMQAHDFVGALKFAEKAQRLYPDLDNISRLLTVCEVHCSSLVKIGGNENDWYRILKIESTVDEATIKKQYRKLALQLHPDKNKFAGAEAAFKLICEANRVLSDQAKRVPFDRKYRDLARNALTKTQANGKTHFRQQSYQPTREQTHTFWTSCTFCSMRYQYFIACMNMMLPCQNCHKEFVAHDIGAKSSVNQQKVPIPKPKPPAEKAKSPRRRTSTPAKAPKPKPEEAESAEVKVENGDVKVDMQGTEKPKPSTAKPEKPESSKAIPKKRGRKQTLESSDSEDFEEKVDVSSESNGRQKRRSARQKQNISYQECLSDDDEFGNKRKRSKASKSDVDETKEEQMSDQHEEKPETDDATESKSTKESVPVSFSYPDPEFHDFDADRLPELFAAGQVWATFDSNESMPRFYASIKKILPSKLKIQWLEAYPDEPLEMLWSERGLPTACGKFEFGGLEDVTFNMCSHKIQPILTKSRNKNIFWVYPRKGETWAIFQNWNIRWGSTDYIERPSIHDYVYVEILSDFDKDSGVSVASLARVKGFVSLFRRSGVKSSQIPPSDLYSFSHQVLSHRMTGKERQGVPEGSFEFDPVSLPSSFFDGSGLDDVKKENESINGDEASVSEKKIPLPRKSPRKTNEKLNSPIKPESKPEAEAFNIRRSPRDANKNKAEASNGGFAKEEKPTKRTPLEKSPIGQLFRKYAPKSPGKSGPGSYDFSKLKSKESFKVNQIWAMRTNGDIFPKTYGLITDLKFTPEFKIFVSALDRSSSSKGSKDPVSCGIFKVKDERSIAFPLSNFSHCVSAVPENNKHGFSIYPREGEIWALYKSHNSDSTCPNPSNGECDIVEVVEEGKKGRKVILLSRQGMSLTLFSASRIHRSKSGVWEIPNSEIARFSHQIPAVKHAGCWELDPASTPAV